MVTNTSSPTAPNPYSANSASRLNAIDWIALVLLIVGGLNWGLVGLFQFDLVAALFGPMSTLSRIVYSLVGLSAVYTIYLLTVLRR